MHSNACCLPYKIPLCLRLSSFSEWDGNPDYDVADCEALSAVLMCAQSGSPLSTENSLCVFSCETWEGKQYGLDFFKGLEDTACLKPSSLNPARHPALCYRALPTELGKLGLSTSWFQCPLKVVDEHAWGGVVYNGDEEKGALLMSGLMHVMAVSWGV